MSDSIRISDLLFNIKLLKDQVKAFQSGEKYLHMKEEYNKMLRDEAEGRVSDTIEQAFVPKVIEFPKQRQA